MVLLCISKTATKHLVDLAGDLEAESTDLVNTIPAPERYLLD